MMAHECCLLDLPRGTRGRVRSLDGDSAERSRLLSMGFTPGAEVEMCGADSESCRVFLRDSSVVLGGHIARRIFCESIDSHGSAGLVDSVPRAAGAPCGHGPHHHYSPGACMRWLHSLGARHGCDASCREENKEK